MATLNFNAAEVTPISTFTAIPVGKYTAVIGASEFRPTRRGDSEYLQLEFEIIEGEYKGRKLWTRLNLHNENQDAVRMAQAELSAICRAVKKLNITDSAELHNIPMVISVKCRKTPDGDLVNDIRGYEELSFQQPALTTDAQPQANGSLLGTGLWGQR